MIDTKQTTLVILFLVLCVNSIKFNKIVPSIPLYRALPCSNEDRITSFFEYGLERGYNVTIKKELEPATAIRLTFDSQAAVLLDESAIFSNADDVNNIFNIILFKNTNSFTFNVLGEPAPFSPPYLTSLKINGEEYCRHPNLTYFTEFPVGVLSQPKDRHCGRRKIIHTSLIVQGYTTKAGDWPWHAAIYKRDGSTLKYICGGTLLSKYFILTAAHCATINGVPVLPDILGVTLGKYNLFQTDKSVQEKRVYEVYIHDEYHAGNLNNDIALLKLKTEVIFNNYVQPACLWEESVYGRLPFEAFGTVVGWGFDQTNSVTSTLHAVNMPYVPDLDCIYTKPEFYGNILRDKKKFCAGFTNGTSACNGDSGGAFVYFAPDVANLRKSSVPGAWYVKGIVSAILARQDVSSICDPNAYGVFTDVAKYLQWIQTTIDS